MLGAPDLAHAADAEFTDQPIAAELLRALLGGSRLLARRGHRTPHAHEVPREHQRDAECDRERATRCQQALLLEPMGRAEQYALRNERREMPVERSDDAGALATDRRDRCEVVTIGRVQLEEPELADRLLRGRSEQRLERRIREVLVAEQAILLRRRLGN